MISDLFVQPSLNIAFVECNIITVDSINNKYTFFCEFGLCLNRFETLTTVTNVQWDQFCWSNMKWLFYYIFWGEVLTVFNILFSFGGSLGRGVTRSAARDLGGSLWWDRAFGSKMWGPTKKIVLGKL